MTVNLSTAWESFWRQTSLESAFMLQINTEWGYPAFLLMSVPQLVNLETLFKKRKNKRSPFYRAVMLLFPATGRAPDRK